MVYTVPIEELEDWLNTQPVNTPDTPYELNITGLTEEDIEDSYVEDENGYPYHQYARLKRILLQNSQNNVKFVDLRNTKLPSLYYYDKTFEDCSCLLYGPDIPSGAFFLDFTFKNSGLKEIPNLPETIKTLIHTFSSTDISSVKIPFGAKYLDGTFENCNNITEVNYLPDTIVSMIATFRDCKNLKKGYIPKNVTDTSLTFYGCDRLETVTIKANYNDSNWFFGIFEIIPTPLEALTVYVSLKQLEQYRANYQRLGVINRDRVLPLYYLITDFINLINDADIITALPSDKPYEKKFNSRTGLTTVNLWNYKIEGYFESCCKFPEKLISADLTGINFSEIEGYSSAFQLCSNLKYLKLPSIDFTNLDVSRMFFGCTSLKVLNLSNCTFNDVSDFSEIFALDNLTVYYDPDKWHLPTNNKLGNAQDIKFLPVTTVDNEMIVDDKPISTFYRDNIEYDKIAINEDIFLLDNYNCLSGYDEKGEVDSESAMGTVENGQFEAWIFSD